jgi:hypothetical protein
MGIRAITLALDTSIASQLLAKFNVCFGRLVVVNIVGLRVEEG